MIPWQHSAVRKPKLVKKPKEEHQGTPLATPVEPVLNQSCQLNVPTWVAPGNRRTTQPTHRIMKNNYIFGSLLYNNKNWNTIQTQYLKNLGLNPTYSSTY